MEYNSEENRDDINTNMHSEVEQHINEENVQDNTQMENVQANKTVSLKADNEEADMENPDNSSYSQSYSSENCGFVLVNDNTSKEQEETTVAYGAAGTEAQLQYGGSSQYQYESSSPYQKSDTDLIGKEVFIKHAPKKKRSWLKTAAVASVSSILGGAVVGAFIMFVLPSIQPSFKEYMSNRFPSDNVTSTAGSNSSTNSTYLNVDLTKDAGTIVTNVANVVSPSVVGIMVTPGEQQVNGFYNFFNSEESSPSEGSGIIIRQDGYIVTNSHVIENALDNEGKLIKNSKIDVYLPGKSDKPYEAQIVGRDSKTDLAVLKIDASNLPAAKFANSENVKVGEIAVAIGNPGGLEYMGSVTVGFISGLNRTVKTEDGKDLTYLQTDAAINPGNSGGALVNANGEVVGVNTIKVVATGFEGLGFAIPSNKVVEITDSLIQYKYVKGRPMLGITAETRYDSSYAKRYGWPEGVYVSDVTAFSGAYTAGIKANDIITKIDGTEVKTLEELKTQISKHKPGDTVEVEIYRNGKTEKIKVTLSEDKG